MQDQTFSAEETDLKEFFSKVSRWDFGGEQNHCYSDWKV